MALYGKRSKSVQARITAGIRKHHRKASYKKEQSLRSTLFWKSTKQRDRQSRVMIANHNKNFSFIRRYRKGIRNQYLSPEVRKMRAENGRRVLRRAWKDPVFIKTINNSHVHPSKPQISIFKFLSRMGISGHKIEYTFCTFSLDIAFPESRLAIEIDGAYWHTKTDHLERDKKKELRLKFYGWKLLRVSSDHIEKEKPGILSWIEKNL